MTDTQRLIEALAEPFDPADVGWKAQAVKGNRALAAGYIDARDVMDRLDAVLGGENWQDEYDALTDGAVVCRLRLNLGGDWVTKMDVGSPSDQPDGGDRLKAAFSDALKRAAVKFGIGRYLYRLPPQWVEYDPVRKQFTQTPALPAWALPKPPAPEDELARSKEKFWARLQRTGLDWTTVLSHLNLDLKSKTGSAGGYTRATRWDDLPPDHRRALSRLVLTLPDGTASVA